MNLAQKVLNGDKSHDENINVSNVKEIEIHNAGDDIDDPEMQIVSPSETDSVASFFLPEKRINEIEKPEPVNLRSFYFFRDYNDNSEEVRQRYNQDQK
jgi:hypothetical protein